MSKKTGDNKNGKNNKNDKNQFPERNQELRRERRRQAAFERLGTNNPRCIHCGEIDPLVLERHHLAGRAFSEATVIACRNHHRILSDWQRDHAAKITEIPDPLEVIAHFLLGLADLFELLVRKFREFAEELLERADPNKDNLPETP